MSSSVINFLVGLTSLLWFVGVMLIVLVALPFYLAGSVLGWAIDKLFDHLFRNVLK